VVDQRATIEKGSHTMNWNVPHNLKPGNYIYHLILGDKEQSGKVILNR
jgi:hypothetical protein